MDQFRRLSPSFRFVGRAGPLRTGHFELLRLVTAGVRGIVNEAEGDRLAQSAAFHSGGQIELGPVGRHFNCVGRLSPIFSGSYCYELIGLPLRRSCFGILGIVCRFRIPLIAHGVLSKQVAAIRENPYSGACLVDSQVGQVA
jgi:hypothetical protein